MGTRLSELYGMDIYSQKAQFVGTVKDVILNLDKGEVMRLCLESLKGSVLSNEDLRFLKKSSRPIGAIELKYL